MGAEFNDDVRIRVRRKRAIPQAEGHELLYNFFPQNCNTDINFRYNEGAEFNFDVRKLIRPKRAIPEDEGGELIYNWFSKLYKSVSTSGKSRC